VPVCGCTDFSCDNRCVTHRATTKLAAVVVLALLSTGCALALSPPSAWDPRFDRANLSTLASGQTPADVAGRMGAPVWQQQRDREIDWRYESVFYPKGCSTTLFGLTVRERPRERRQLELRFGPAGLQRAILMERLPERTLRTDLLAAR
jgi:hypothetical protein